MIPSPWSDKRILATREPVGVTAGITPWNFPSAMVTRKSAPALAVGCTMILKPAEQTPLSALAVAALAEEAGVPAGVFSVVTGDAADAPVIGGELTSNPLVRKLGFTGSTEVGKLLMRQCADQVKKVSLELGGNAPFIVFDDADLERRGRVCARLQVPQLGPDLHLGEPDARPGRDLRRVPRALHGSRSAQLVVADGFTDGVQVGPLIDEPALDKVESHVGDALERGAELVAGGERLEGSSSAPRSSRE